MQCWLTTNVWLRLHEFQCKASQAIWIELDYMHYILHVPSSFAIGHVFRISLTRISYFLVKDGGWEWDSTEDGERSRNRGRPWTLQRLRKWRTSFWWWVRLHLFVLLKRECGKCMFQALFGIQLNRSRGNQRRRSLIPRKHAPLCEYWSKDNIEGWMYV